MSETPLRPNQLVDIQQLNQTDPLAQAEALKNAFPENRPEVLADFLRKHAGNTIDPNSLLSNLALPNLLMGSPEP